MTIVVDSVDAAAFPEGVRGLLDAIAPNDFPFTFLDPSQQYQTPTGALTPAIGAYNGAGPDLVLELRASAHPVDNVRGLYHAYMDAILAVAHGLDVKVPKRHWYKHA